MFVFHTSARPGGKFADIPFSDSQICAKSFENDEFSDLIITCQGRLWRVHRNIVCYQSEPLYRAIKGPYIEWSNSTINLPAGDPEHINAMISFLYLEKYTAPSTTAPDDPYNPLIFDMDVYTIAEKYFVRSLESFALKKLASNASCHWRTSVFANAFEWVYGQECEHTNVSKHILVDVAVANIKALQSAPECAAFQSLLQDGPRQIALDILSATTGVTMDRLFSRSSSGSITSTLS